MASSSVIAQPRGLFGDEHHRTQSSSFDPFDSNPANADNSLYTTSNSSSITAPMHPLFSQSRPDSPQSSSTFDNHPPSSFHNTSLQSNNDFYNQEAGLGYRSPIDEPSSINRQHQLFTNPFQTSTAFSSSSRTRQQQQQQAALANGGLPGGSGGILSHQSSAHTLSSLYSSSGDGLSPIGGPSASAFSPSDLYGGPLHVSSDLSMSGYSSNDGMSPYDSFEFVDRGVLRPSYAVPNNQPPAPINGSGILPTLNTTSNIHNTTTNGILGSTMGPASATLNGVPTPSTAVAPSLRDTLRDAREGPRDIRDRDRDRDLSVDNRRDGGDRTGATGTSGSGGDRSGGNGVGEEISTIFVVGFPDDMQEREFQNMFTFCKGFEAATLKIPNKDSTAYGAGQSSSASGAGTSGMSGPSERRGTLLGGYGPGVSSGSGDPYNLVTINSGGLVVDSRDVSAAWPNGSSLVSGSSSSDEGGPYHSGSHPTQQQQGQSQAQSGQLPPRKQIIGFAKFATRADALYARDVLQSKRIDAEKSAVLKAEMAKKNLHTKRGVGSNAASGPNVGSGGGASSATATITTGAMGTIVTGLGETRSRDNGLNYSSLTNLGNHPANTSMLSSMPDPHTAFALSVREREQAALAALGVNSTIGPQPSLLSSSGHGNFSSSLRGNAPPFESAVAVDRAGEARGHVDDQNARDREFYSRLPLAASHETVLPQDRVLGHQRSTQSISGSSTSSRSHFEEFEPRRDPSTYQPTGSRPIMMIPRIDQLGGTVFTGTGAEDGDGNASTPHADAPPWPARFSASTSSNNTSDMIPSSQASIAPEAKVPIPRSPAEGDGDGWEHLSAQASSDPENLRAHGNQRQHDGFEERRESHVTEMTELAREHEDSTEDIGGVGDATLIAPLPPSRSDSLTGSPRDEQLRSQYEEGHSVNTDPSPKHSVSDVYDNSEPELGLQHDVSSRGAASELGSSTSSAPIFEKSESRLVFDAGDYLPPAEAPYPDPLRQIQEQQEQIQRSVSVLSRASSRRSGRASVVHESMGLDSMPSSRGNMISEAAYFEQAASRRSGRNSTAPQSHDSSSVTSPIHEYGVSPFATLQRYPFDNVPLLSRSGRANSVIQALDTTYGGYEDGPLSSRPVLGRISRSNTIHDLHSPGHETPQPTQSQSQLHQPQIPPRLLAQQQALREQRDREREQRDRERERERKYGSSSSSQNSSSPPDMSAVPVGYGRGQSHVHDDERGWRQDSHFIPTSLSHPPRHSLRSTTYGDYAVGADLGTLGGSGSGGIRFNESVFDVVHHRDEHPEGLDSRFGDFSIGGQSDNTSPPLLHSPPLQHSGANGSRDSRVSLDQNPPINTLYVGNLPTTTSSSATNVLLEENLRLAFSRCPGFRKLCFRQKSNGPMCFVEFEDVHYATRALNEMYGHTLNGLIKNGIRLSYSKNPLGVRSPSLSNGAAGPPPGLHSLHEPTRLGSIDAGRYGGQNIKSYDNISLETHNIPPRRQREGSLMDTRLSTSNFETPGPRMTRHMSLSGASGFGGGFGGSDLSSGLSVVPEHNFSIGGGFDRAFHPTSASSPPPRPQLPSRYFSPTGERAPAVLSPILPGHGMSSIFGGLGGSGGGFGPIDEPQNRQASTRSTFSPFGNDVPFGETQDSFPVHQHQQQQSSLYQRLDERDELFTPASERFNHGIFDGGLPTTLYNSNNFTTPGLSMSENNPHVGDTH